MQPIGPFVSIFLCLLWFSSDISARHILNAARNLVNLDERQVNAVATRSELDLRIGYAFTRFLTNNLRALGGPLAALTLSYGTFRSVFSPFPR